MKKKTKLIIAGVATFLTIAAVVALPCMQKNAKAEAVEQESEFVDEAEFVLSGMDEDKMIDKEAMIETSKELKDKLK